MNEQAGAWIESWWLLGISCCTDLRPCRWCSKLVQSDVTVNESVILVNIDLGTADASACAHGIPSGEAVDITLIVKAVL